MNSCGSCIFTALWAIGVQTGDKVGDLNLSILCALLEGMAGSRVGPAPRNVVNRLVVAAATFRPTGSPPAHPCPATCPLLQVPHWVALLPHASVVGAWCFFGETQVLSNAFTFTAVPSAIVHAGADPVYVDCEDNYILDLVDLEAKMVSSGAKWLVVSHMRGKVSDMDAIVELCKKHGVRFIEDCAHSLGVSAHATVTGPRYAPMPTQRVTPLRQ